MRSLYQCFKAKVYGDAIYCSAGHLLAGGETISILPLKRGSPLEFTVCQGCKDYEEMGASVLRDDRGWQLKCITYR